MIVPVRVDLSAVHRRSQVYGCEPAPAFLVSLRDVYVASSEASLANRGKEQAVPVLALESVTGVRADDIDRASKVDRRAPARKLCVLVIGNHRSWFGRGDGAVAGGEGERSGCNVNDESAAKHGSVLQKAGTARWRGWRCGMAKSPCGPEW